jgi:hypothetical protein
MDHDIDVLDEDWPEINEDGLVHRLHPPLLPYVRGSTRIRVPDVEARPILSVVGGDVVLGRLTMDDDGYVHWRCRWGAWRSPVPVAAGVWATVAFSDLWGVSLTTETRGP